MTRNIYIFMFVLLLLMVFIFNTRETFLGHEYKLVEHVDYKGRVNQYNVEERPFIFDTSFEPKMLFNPPVKYYLLNCVRKNDIDYDITCDNENCFINNNIITIRNSGKYIFDFQGFSDNDVVLTKLFKINRK